jgi:hypothetical protein
MGEDLLVSTAGVLQGVGQDGEPVGVQVAGGQFTVVVEGLGLLLDRTLVLGEPGGAETDWADEAAEQITEQIRLVRPC